MIKRPKLKSFLTVFPISDTAWGLRGGSDELWRLSLGHEEAMRTFTALLGYLNGQHEIDAILAKLEEQGIAPQAARRVLDQLAEASLIEDASHAELSARELSTFRDQITLFSRFTSQGGAIYQRALRQSRVAICGENKLSESVERQLMAAGFGNLYRLVAGEEMGEQPVVEEQDLTEVETIALDPKAIWPSAKSAPDLLIVPQQAHDPELLESVHAFSERSRVPWLLLQALDVREGWVGPLFIPGETASYPSLDARLRGNLPFYDEHQAFDRMVRKTGKAAADLGGLHAFLDLLASIAVIESIKLLSGFRYPDLAGRFVSVDPWTWELETHEVLKVPWVDHGLGASPTPYPWREESSNAASSD